ncbi:MAG: hypothetical protein ABL921_10520 [Pirellula sp.]
MTQIIADKEIGDVLHTVSGNLNTGSAIILAADGGHRTLNVGNDKPPVPKNAPPAFITCAGAGDRVHAIWASDYFSAMLQASIPNVEMHIYGNGYHPGDRGSSGGMTWRNGIPFGTWHERFVDWFRDLGFLEKPGVETKAALDTQAFVKPKN